MQIYISTNRIEHSAVTQIPIHYLLFLVIILVIIFAIIFLIPLLLKRNSAFAEKYLKDYFSSLFNIENRLAFLFISFLLVIIGFILIISGALSVRYNLLSIGFDAFVAFGTIGMAYVTLYSIKYLQETEKKKEGGEKKGAYKIFIERIVKYLRTAINIEKQIDDFMKKITLFLLLTCFLAFTGSVNAMSVTKLKELASHGNIKALKELAKRGFVIAEYDLGILYIKGQGVQQDYYKAAHWFKKAAAQGNAQAENDLGLLYTKGIGIPQNSMKAAYWFKKAAGQGNAQAENNLGYVYVHDQGVQQNYDKAVYWYKKLQFKAMPKLKII